MSGPRQPPLWEAGKPAIYPLTYGRFRVVVPLGPWEYGDFW